MGIRINKYLSEAGVCSRREADRQLEAGNVMIDGHRAQPGDRVQPGQKVVFCGREVEKEEEMILLAVNKPVGIVCTAEKREKHNIVDFINYPKRIYPVGRLDKDSEGLILMTCPSNFCTSAVYSASGSHTITSSSVTRNALAISLLAEKDLPEPGVPRISPLGFLSFFRSTIIRLLDRAFSP